MQKQIKQLIFVIVLLVLFVAAYVGIRAYNSNQEKKTSQEEEADKIYVSNIGKDKITSFSYQAGEETLEFAKENEKWVSENDRTITLDQSAIDTMLNTMAVLEAEAIVEEPEELSEYGMDTPTNVIAFSTDDGTTTLTIGMENQITNQYYMTKDGDDTLYLVADSVANDFQKTLEELKAEEKTEPTEGTEAE